MPRHPDVSGPANALPASIFARLVERLASFSGEVIPFHLGDTHLRPPEAAWLERMSFEEARPCALSAYAPPQGDPRLIEALVSKLAVKNGISVAPSELQIT